jgi:hypothetical protein
MSGSDYPPVRREEFRATFRQTLDLTAFGTEQSAREIFAESQHPMISAWRMASILAPLVALAAALRSPEFLESAQATDALS